MGALLACAPALKPSPRAAIVAPLWPLFLAVSGPLIPLLRRSRVAASAILGLVLHRPTF